MNLKRGSFALCTVFFLLLTLSLGSAEISYREGIHLLRPESGYVQSSLAVQEYIDVEDLTFVSCLEDDIPIRNSILCVDDNSFEDLDVVKWTQNDNCYLSSYNLENFECENLIIRAEFTVDGENNMMTKRIRVNKLTKVLDRAVDAQFSDGGWYNSISTAYGIWALSHFSEVFQYELDRGVDWLKLNRNENYKCWPKAPCNVELSSNILALLTLSNYTESRRAVNDARNWLEELQNYYSDGDEWTIQLKAVSSNTTIVILSYEGEILDLNFTLPQDDAVNYTFSAHVDSELMLIADDNLMVDIYNQDDDILINYQGDNLSFVVPGACWSLNRPGEPCDDTTSMFAMIADIDDDQLEAAKEWARTQIKRGDIVGVYFGDEDVVTDTSLYLYNLYDDDSGEVYLNRLTDWVLYRQNNDGSWGTGTTDERLVPTSFAVLSLLEAGYNRSAEPIRDAEEWVSTNEENITVNNTVALGSAFFILKHHAHPLLASDPKIITLDGPSTAVDLLNPTTFNLRDVSLTFSDEVKNYLSIEQKDEITSYSYRRFDITRKDVGDKDIYGFLDVTNLGVTIAHIPVVVTNSPQINVSYQDTISVFGLSGEIPLKIFKTNHEFSCKMAWEQPDIATLGSLRIRKGDVLLPVTFTESLTADDVYSGTLTCTAVGRVTKIPLSVYIQRFSEFPLSVSPKDIILNSSEKNLAFTLSNNLDRDLAVKISIDRYADYFVYRDSILLDPNEHLNYTITTNLPSDINLTSSVLVSFTALNRTEISSVLIDVVALPPEKPNVMAVILLWSLIALGSAALGYTIWRFRDFIYVELNKIAFWKIREQKKQEVQKIHTVKLNEKRQAIINIYNILKFQNKDDKELAARLLKTFSKEEITDALDTIGAALPVLAEEEPEKV